VIDGHKSRLSFLATMIFCLNSIEVLVLHVHFNQFLQTFDPAVASPLKVAFKQGLINSSIALLAHIPSRENKRKSSPES
jgi:hypothetical protein